MNPVIPRAYGRHDNLHDAICAVLNDADRDDRVGDLCGIALQAAEYAKQDAKREAARLDTRKLQSVGDVLGWLYDVEHAGPYCSPLWGRNGTRVVIAALIANPISGGARSVSTFLRKTTAVPRRNLGDLVFGGDTDQALWDRARAAIADAIDKQSDPPPEMAPRGFADVHVLIALIGFWWLVAVAWAVLAHCLSADLERAVAERAASDHATNVCLGELRNTVERVHVLRERIDLHNAIVEDACACWLPEAP